MMQHQINRALALADNQNISIAIQELQPGNKREKALQLRDQPAAATGRAIAFV